MKQVRETNLEIGEIKTQIKDTIKPKPRLKELLKRLKSAPGGP